MAGDDDLLSSDPILLWPGQLKVRVGIGAVRALGAEAGQVVEAEDAADMSVPARGAVPAEAPVIPGTVLDLALGVDVQEGALLVVASIWNIDWIQPPLPPPTLLLM